MALDLSFCRAGGCQCPQFDSPNGSFGHPCELCQHHVLWHHRSVTLSLEAIRAKERGHAMERCKSSGCDCPIWVGEEGRMDGEGVNCFLCSHRRGWHLASLERAEALEQQRKDHPIRPSVAAASIPQDSKDITLASSPPRRNEPPQPASEPASKPSQASSFFGFNTADLLRPRPSSPSVMSTTTASTVSFPDISTLSTSAPSSIHSSVDSYRLTESSTNSPPSTEIGSPPLQSQQRSPPNVSAQLSNTIYIPPAPPRAPSPHSLPQITTEFPTRPVNHPHQRPVYGAPQPQGQRPPKPIQVSSHISNNRSVPVPDQLNLFQTAGFLQQPPGVQVIAPSARRASEPASPTRSMLSFASQASTSSGKERRATSKQWETHESKNVELSVCPPLTTTVVYPGDIIKCRVKLSPKVALNNYDKLDVTFVGISIVAGEPPDTHTFLQVMKSILPRSADVKTEGLTNREWTFEFEVPENMNCACRGSTLAIPPTYRHDEVLIKYTIELMGKRKERFSTNDKIPIQLVVQRRKDNPVILPLPPDVGTDDIWRFVRASKKSKSPSYVILVEGQRAPITDAEIAYHVVKPRSSSSTVYVNYRLSLHFPPNSALAQENLNAMYNNLRISLSRRIMVRKLSKGKDKDKETLLPALRISSKVKQIGVGTVHTELATIWRIEGRVETTRDEVLLWNSCNAEVRFVLSAYISHPSLSADISTVVPITDFTPIQSNDPNSDAHTVRSSRSSSSRAPSLAPTTRSSGMDSRLDPRILDTTVSPFLTSQPSSQSSHQSRLSDNQSIYSGHSSFISQEVRRSFESRMTDNQSIHIQDTRQPINYRMMGDNISIAASVVPSVFDGGYGPLTGGQMVGEPIHVPQTIHENSAEGREEPALGANQSWDTDFSRLVSQAGGEHLPPPLYHNAVHDAPYHPNQA